MNNPAFLLHKVLFITQKEHNIQELDKYLNSNLFNISFAENLIDDDLTYDLYVIPINYIELISEYMLPVVIIYTDKNQVHFISQLTCDDFLVTPFTYNEFKVRAKRVVNEIQISTQIGILYLSISKIRFHNNEVKITSTEFLILKELLKSKNRILEREYINRKYFWENRVLDAHICNIRKKLMKVTANKSEKIFNIGSIKNIGYYIEFY